MGKGVATAGFLACGSSPFWLWPSQKRFGSGGRQPAIRSQLRGQPRSWSLDLVNRTAFPIIPGSLASLGTIIPSMTSLFAPNNAVSDSDRTALLGRPARCHRRQRDGEDRRNSSSTVMDPAAGDARLKSCKPRYGKGAEVLTKCQNNKTPAATPAGHIMLAAASLRAPPLASPPPINTCSQKRSPPVSCRRASRSYHPLSNRLRQVGSSSIAKHFVRN